MTDMGRRTGLPIVVAALALAAGNAAETSAEGLSEMKAGKSSPLWSRSVAVQTASPARITIEGVELDGRFVPQRVSIPDEEPEHASEAALPFGESAIRSSDHPEIRCGDGAAPADGIVRLDPINLKADRLDSRASRVGTWLWHAESWLAQPGQVEAWAVASQIDRIFLQLKIADGEVTGMTVLADLVSRLRRQGIAVHAVEGDPAMVTADGLDHALLRVAAIRRYQGSSQPDTRLSGLQFDIEPYLLTDFARDPASAWSQWASAIHALSSTWGEPVSVVVPFWMLNSEGGKAAVETARPSVSDLTVMAYRTQIDEVTALSEPWLTWGALNDIPVSVAIENGPLSAEVHRTFVRAETGSVQLRMEGDRASVALLSEPVETQEDTLAYALHQEMHVNPARISFANNQAKLAVARVELTRLFVAWPSFNGLMIHALGEPDHDLGRATPDAGGQSQ